MRMIESAIARQRDVFGEEHFRPHTKRCPLHPVVLRITVPGPLVNENWHNRKPVVGLKDYLFGGQKLSRVIDKRRRIWAGCAVATAAEVAGHSGSVLEGK